MLEEKASGSVRQSPIRDPAKAPPETRPKLSLIIPAHNEAERLPRTLRAYASAVTARFGDAVEILVVANGCSDETAQVAEGLRQELPLVRVIDIPDAVGKGGAVLEGFRQAAGDAVLFADADAATDPTSLLALVDQLDRYDVAIGSRYVSGSRIEHRQPLARRLLSRLFNLVVRAAFGLPFADTQCGAKALRGDTAKRLADIVRERQWTFDLDLLLSARRLGLSIVERAVVWSDVAGSHLRVGTTALHVAASIFKLWLHDGTRRAIPQQGSAPPASLAPGARRILALNWRCYRHPEAGGAELNLFEQARRWRAADHNVTIVTAGQASGVCLPPLEICDGIVIRRMGGRFTVYLRVAWFLIWNGYRYDYILDVSNGIPFFSPLFTSVSSVLMVHHVCNRQWYEEFASPVATVGWFLERAMVPLVFRHRPVIAVSPTTRDALVETGFSASQITLVYNGVTGQAVPAAATSTTDQATPEARRPSVVYVGRLMRYKRLDRLVSVFAAARGSVPEALLRIVGDGETRPLLEELVGDLAIDDAVTLHGYVDEATKNRLLAEATVFATTSTQEGWGLSVIEANWHGVPCVAFNVPGLSAAIVDGETGFLAEDEDSFRDALLRLLMDHSLRERMSDAARSWARRFSWDQTAVGTLEVLESGWQATRESQRLRRAA